MRATLIEPIKKAFQEACMAWRHERNEIGVELLVCDTFSKNRRPIRIDVTPTILAAILRAQRGAVLPSTPLRLKMFGMPVEEVASLPAPGWAIILPDGVARTVQ